MGAYSLGGLWEPTVSEAYGSLAYGSLQYREPMGAYSIGGLCGLTVTNRGGGRVEFRGLGVCAFFSHAHRSYFAPQIPLD